MTYYTPDVTEDMVFTAVVGFLNLILPGLGTDHIIQGQGNRTPPPPEPEYILVTPAGRVRLAQNSEAWDFSDPANGATDTSQSTQFAVDVEVHGDSSGDTAQLITTVFRSDYAVTSFPSNVTPLYCDDPQQLVFQDAEAQAENRWQFKMFLQITPTVSTPQQSANTLGVKIAPPADSGAP